MAQQSLQRDLILLLTDERVIGRTLIRGCTNEELQHAFGVRQIGHGGHHNGQFGLIEPVGVRTCESYCE